MRLLVSAQEMPGDDARAALHQASTNSGKVLGLTRRGQHVDEGDGGVLVRLGKRREDGSMAPGPEILQLRDGFLRGRALRVGRGPDLRDQPVGAQVGEKAHGSDEQRPARGNDRDVRARMKQACRPLQPGPCYKNYAIGPGMRPIRPWAPANFATNLAPLWSQTPSAEFRALRSTPTWTPISGRPWATAQAVESVELKGERAHGADARSDFRWAAIRRSSRAALAAHLPRPESTAGRGPRTGMRDPRPCRAAPA